MAEPRTINLPGSGADTQSYTLAPGLLQYVQSVRVTIDNSAGGDATPVLSVAEQAGVVIADVPQNAAITGGESDAAATWALRLDDRAAASSGGTVAHEVLVCNSVTVTPNNDTDFSFSHSAGAVLMDLTFPTLPSFVAAGGYIVTAWAFDTALPASAGKVAVLKMFENINPAGPSNAAWQSVPYDASPNAISASVTLPWAATAGQRVHVTIEQNTVANKTWACYLNIVQVA